MLNKRYTTLLIALVVLFVTTIAVNTVTVDGDFYFGAPVTITVEVSKALSVGETYALDFSVPSGSWMVTPINFLAAPNPSSLDARTLGSIFCHGNDADKSIVGELFLERQYMNLLITKATTKVICQGTVVHPDLDSYYIEKEWFGLAGDLTISRISVASDNKNPIVLDNKYTVDTSKMTEKPALSPPPAFTSSWKNDANADAYRSGYYTFTVKDMKAGTVISLLPMIGFDEAVAEADPNISFSGKTSPYQYFLAMWSITVGARSVQCTNGAILDWPAWNSGFADDSDPRLFLHMPSDNTQTACTFPLSTHIWTALLNNDYSKYHYNNVHASFGFNAVQYSPIPLADLGAVPKTDMLSTSINLWYHEVTLRLQSLSKPVPRMTLNSFTSPGVQDLKKGFPLMNWGYSFIGSTLTTPYVAPTDREMSQKYTPNSWYDDRFLSNHTKSGHQSSQETFISLPLTFPLPGKKTETSELSVTTQWNRNPFSFNVTYSGKTQQVDFFPAIVGGPNNDNQGYFNYIADSNSLEIGIPFAIQIQNKIDTFITPVNATLSLILSTDIRADNAVFSCVGPDTLKITQIDTTTDGQHDTMITKQDNFQLIGTISDNFLLTCTIKIDASKIPNQAAINQFGVVFLTQSAGLLSTPYQTMDALSTGSTITSTTNQDYLKISNPTALEALLVNPVAIDTASTVGLVMTGPEIKSQVDLDKMIDDCLALINTPLTAGGYPALVKTSLLITTSYESIFSSPYGGMNRASTNSDGKVWANGSTLYYALKNGSFTSPEGLFKALASPQVTEKYSIRIITKPFTALTGITPRYIDTSTKSSSSSSITGSMKLLATTQSDGKIASALSGAPLGSPCTSTSQCFVNRSRYYDPIYYKYQTDARSTAYCYENICQSWDSLPPKTRAAMVQSLAIPDFAKFGIKYDNKQGVFEEFVPYSSAFNMNTMMITIISTILAFVIVF